MIITRMCPFTRIYIHQEIDVTELQLKQWQYQGISIQDAMPNLTPSEREFIKTGLTDETFPKGDDE